MLAINEIKKIIIKYTYERGRKRGGGGMDYEANAQRAT